VLLVDDDREYLVNVQNILDRDTAMYVSFNNPNELYEYVKSHFKRQHLLEQCIQQKTDTAPLNTKIKFILEPIQQEVFNTKRFEHISAIVADHDMPQMKGLDFFKKIKDLPIRKILLTGRTTVKEVLDAFNNGIIDQYISKDIENFDEYLNETIKSQCNEQFKNDTKIIIKNLILERQGHESSCLDSEVFITLLANIVKEYRISEYYLIDKNGSYICFDKNARPSWLIVKNQDALNADILLAAGGGTPASAETIQQLKEHKLILALLSEQDREVPAKDWMTKGLLHPLKKFTIDKQDYYYVYIDQNTSSDIFDKSKITSFDQYKDQLLG
jgi:CheY-like chemotaxis protein